MAPTAQRTCGWVERSHKSVTRGGGWTFRPDTPADAAQLLQEVPVYAHGYLDELDAIDPDGHVPVPRGAGPGVTIDWAWMRANEVGTVVYECWPPPWGPALSFDQRGRRMLSLYCLK